MDDGGPQTHPLPTEPAPAQAAEAPVLDPDRGGSTAEADLATTTDEARRDAPAIAVGDVRLRAHR